MARVEPYQFLDRRKLQFQLVARTFAPFAKFLLHEGDDRGFSTSSRVTYRTAVFVVFDLSTARITEGPTGHSTGTRTDRSNPKLFAKVHASSLIHAGVPGRSFMTTVTCRGKVANPWIQWGSPNIDTRVVLSAVLDRKYLRVSGRVAGDTFPSTEVFLRDHDRHSCMLFTYATSGGPTTGPITRLPGRGGLLGSFKKVLLLNQNGGFHYSVGAVDPRVVNDA